MNHDRLFKELIGSFFIEFVDLLLPDLAPYIDRDAEIIPLDKEVFTDITGGDSHEVDLIMKLKFKGEDVFFLIHVENQSKRQPHFPKRMFNYFSRLSEKFDLPVYPVAVFSYRSPKRAEPDHYQVSFPNKTVMRFEYTVIQLQRIPWRAFLKHDNPMAAALMSTMKMDKSERPLVKLECLRLLARLKLDPARSKLIGGFLDSYLKLNANELKQFEREREELLPKEREETVALVSSWESRGIELGLKQGRQEGLHDGKEQLIVRLINRRMGKIVPSLTNRITALTPAQLDDLGEALLDFTDSSDLDHWLANQPST